MRVRFGLVYSEMFELFYTLKKTWTLNTVGGMFIFSLFCALSQQVRQGLHHTVVTSPLLLRAALLKPRTLS